MRHWHWLAASVLVVWPSCAQETNAPRLVTGEAIRVGASPTLRSLPPGRSGRLKMMPDRPLHRGRRFVTKERFVDPVLQLSPGIESMPAPVATFEGLSNEDNAAVNGGGVVPPDPNGDVGPNHYVQMVNQLIQVYDKSGAPLTVDPLSLSGLFASFGGLCQDGIVSDPIVLYDSLADRWLMSFVAFDVGIDPITLQVAPVPPFHECVACSQTADPTGEYYLYDFQMPNTWVNDYPKFGVWPDAYYMTDNQFDAATDDPHGAGVFAFDRGKLLTGDS